MDVVCQATAPLSPSAPFERLLDRSEQLDVSARSSTHEVVN
jgi:hypothetical protein